MVAPDARAGRTASSWSALALFVGVLNGAVGGLAAFWLYDLVQWPVDALTGLPPARYGWLVAVLPRACFAAAVGLAVVIVLSGVNDLFARWSPDVARYATILRVAVTIAVLVAIVAGSVEFVLRKPIL